MRLESSNVRQFSHSNAQDGVRLHGVPRTVHVPVCGIAGTCQNRAWRDQSGVKGKAGTLCCFEGGT